MTGTPSPVTRILNLVKLERQEISAVYFYAILNGLILLAIPVGIQSLVGFAQTNTASASIIVLIILIVVSVFTAGVLQIKQMQLIEKIQQKIFVRYSFDIARQIPLIQLSAVDNYYLPELLNRFFDIPNLQKSLAKLLLDFPLAIIQIIFGLLLLAFYHPVFIAFGFLLVIVIWGILYFSGNKGLQTSIEESNYKYQTANWLQEMARTIRSVKFSRSPDFVLQKVDEPVSKYLNARTSHFKILELQYKTLIGFKTLVTSAMLIVGAFLLLNQQLNVGQFIASEIVILTVISSVEKLIGNLDSVYDILTSVEKIEKITDKEIENSGSILLSPTDKGPAITVQNVSFVYPGSTMPALNNISFIAGAGEKICIRGDDGSGKSTLLRLIAGCYTDFTGVILLNNIPVINYNLQSIRQQTGVIISQQDIFEGTLLENICMGLEGVSIEEVLSLCNKTGLTPYISTLKNGFDTPLSAAGRKLPGHVVKKILLVRALINKPKLLLLEEPWAGMEEKYQQQIKQLLLDEMVNATVIVITKDEAFAKACHKIIELKHDGSSITS
jgi:ABC-type bacteriocin/lantibiotic exporter with double-glycine peptidase domain